MLCPKCKIVAQISSSKTVVEGDKSADTETKVFTVQEFSCRNKQCSENGKVIGEIKHQIY